MASQWERSNFSRSLLLLAVIGLVSLLSFVHAKPLDIQCNYGSGTQISDDGLQIQTQTGPGCQTQVSDDGSQIQSQTQTGSGIQTQSQCSGINCAQLEPITWKPLEFRPFRPFQ
ncbi:uncharacterized protein LOC26529684 [Drosophila willistoni]|nr:uncharacterized protein LOC26529684 [Drosophila willistoni]